MMGTRTAPCPNCSAPISFGLASSPALVCEFCHFVVIRNDQGFRSAGKMADLVPTVSPFEVRDTISIEGRNATVMGRSQRDWGMGPWDEFYVAFDDGLTLWLASAQGNWYATTRVDPTGTSLSTWDQSVVGARNIRLAQDPRPWMINEKKRSTLIAAKGEFDAPLAVGEISHYLDLSAEQGGFATADFGDLAEPPSLYIGRVLPGNAVSLVSSALGPRPEQRVDVTRLQCLHCGAPIPLFVPQETQRMVCASCGAVLNTKQGKLELLEVLGQHYVALPEIPLGTKGTLNGVEYLVIGFMQRYTVVEGARYNWGEYLLYSSDGYAWLVQDNSAYMLTRTISNSDVAPSTVLNGVSYQGTNFKRYFENQAHVAAVVGEFYWQVVQGETVFVSDYIAPPRVISIERNESEIITSLSEHVPHASVEKAFGVSLRPGVGVPVASPNPVRLGPLVLLFVASLLLIFVLGVVHTLRMPETPVLRQLPLQVDSKNALPGDPFTGTAGAGVSDPARSVTYTEPFTVRRGPTTLGVTLRTDATNVWVGAECALINEDSGEVDEFTLDTGSYRGTQGGESWSEGSQSVTEYVTRVHSGHYSMRCATDWETFSGDGAFLATPVPPGMTLSAVVNERGVANGGLAFLLLFVPLIVAVARRSSHEKGRWENSNVI